MRVRDTVRVMAKPKPDVILTVRIPAPVKRELQEVARADNRSLSNLVETYLIQALAARQPKEQVA
jgi:predicted transcriptional regulator